MGINHPAPENFTPATFHPLDEKKNYPLFPKGTPGVIFGFGHWEDTKENRDLIAQILAERRELQVGITQGQEITRRFIDDMLKNMK